jgi:hypothetical protein
LIKYCRAISEIFNSADLYQLHKKGFLIKKDPIEVFSSEIIDLDVTKIGCRPLPNLRVIVVASINYGY